MLWQFMWWNNADVLVLIFLKNIYLRNEVI
jgi:hypothetical protein